MRTKRKFSAYYVLILMIMVLAVGGYYAIQAINGRSIDNMSVKDNEFYSLRSNATGYERKVHGELIALLKANPRDEARISASLVQNFVADFYTWSNKVRFNDVTAVQFVHPDIQGTVYSQALDTMYNDMNYYLENNQVQDTLQVVGSETTVQPVEFTKHAKPVSDDENSSEDVVVDAYEVHIRWTYKSSTIVNVDEYQNEGTFIVIRNDAGLYSIVEARYE